MRKWYEEAIFYHMYPFGMVGAPKYNDGNTQHHFESLKKWIDHLQEMGISALYIGPLFESTSHGYDTKDYYQIDCRLGTNEEFKQFVQYCHRHNIKVVVDGVFNHTGKQFFAFQDIIANREQSLYCDWYKVIDFSRQAPSGEPFHFGAWHNIYDLANLNLCNPEVKQYLFGVVRYWIHEFKIDGIRLDCADCLDFTFLKELRQLCDHEKDDFWLMGELIHGDYSGWIKEDMLHSSTNYELHKGLYSGHNDHNYFEIAHSIRRQFDAQGGIYKGMKLYTFVDNHDVDRLASKLTKKEHLPLVYTCLFTLPGIPSLYYGSEWGIEGKKEGPNDDPLRPQLSLEAMQQAHQNDPLLETIKALCIAKKQFSSLTYGTYKELLLQNRQYAYARIHDEDCLLVALNNDDQSVCIQIPCPIPYTKAISIHNKQKYIIENNKLTIAMEANSAYLLQLL